MLYKSTRGQYREVSAAEAIKMGIAPDGGLFVPSEEVRVSRDQLKEWAGLDYRGKAVRILKEYLTDFTVEEITECVSLAYNTGRFDTPEIAPVHKLEDSLHVLELWHGRPAPLRTWPCKSCPTFSQGQQLKQAKKRQL